MTLQHTTLRTTLLAMAVSILATAPAAADETPAIEGAPGAVTSRASGLPTFPNVSFV
jgi:hypothetical protein